MIFSYREQCERTCEVESTEPTGASRTGVDAPPLMRSGASKSLCHASELGIY